MVKNAISDYSSTAASNTDVGGVNVDEGMPPSSINNAIRELMSHLADLNAGSSSLGTIKVDNLQLDGNAITSTNTDGDITITPNGNGNVVLDGINYPQVDGTANYFLKTNGAGQLSFAQVGSASIVDNSIGATQLNVSGNGTSGQVLASDGDGTFSWADAPSAFSYNAVSGTTPSLNLGSYNFFNQGALTGDTTVSFASVPTEHKWEYTFQPSGASANYDLTKLRSDGEKVRLKGSGVNTSTDASASLAHGMDFSSDGLNLYITDDGGDCVQQYSLKSPYQITTAEHVYRFSLVSTIGSAPDGLRFSSDGTKMYVGINDNLAQYNLSTAWDLSTASYSSISSAVSSTTTSHVQAFDFKSDGTKLFTYHADGVIRRFSLSTAWTISTASYDGQSFNVASSVTVGTIEYGMRLSSDGTKIIVLSLDGNLAKLTLSTAYDLTTASLSQEQNWSSIPPIYFTDSGLPRSFHMLADGSKMWLQGFDEDILTGYDFIDAYDLTLPSSVQNSPKPLFANQTVKYTFFTGDGGTNVYLIDEQQTWNKI